MGRWAYLALVLTLRRPALHPLPDLWPLRWRQGGLAVRFQLCPLVLFEGERHSNAHVWDESERTGCTDTLASLIFEC